MTSTMTPMQAQYNQIKSRHPNEIVLFRLGDFYEAFNLDAEKLSNILGITLTGRGKGDKRVPMAGIPYHSLDNYLPKLLKAGEKVALVEQLTDPVQGKIVERDVTKIYTPGTLTEENALSESTNNFIASIYMFNAGKDPKYSAALCDISTGKLEVFEVNDKATLLNTLLKLNPSEIIMSDSLGELDLGFTSQITRRSDLDFEYNENYKLCITQFGTKNLKGFGIEEMTGAITALGALLRYISDCQKTTLEHLKSVSTYHVYDYMQLDSNTIKNLEIFTSNSGNDKSTLYSVINACQTNMGKRKLRQWLLHPLISKENLQERLDAVEQFFNSQLSITKLQNLLKEIGDIERIIGRVGVGNASARDLVTLADGLALIPSIKTTLSELAESSFIHELQKNIELNQDVEEVQLLINNSIEPEAPNTIIDGGIIKSGYNVEVDELRDLRQGGKNVLAQIQSREIERTGITTLKVSYNRVFGYYIEITNSHKDKVPNDYIRKQTLSNAERYITEELKQWEEKIMAAEDKLVRLEYDIFVGIRSRVAASANNLLQIANVIAELDVIVNFAHIAKQYRFIKPRISDSSEFIVNSGRHPVIERLQDQFVANDLTISEKSQFILLTGPNMSGKSTYIRQVALIALLAQIGSFVPAKDMTFEIVDRIFTRIGAADNLSRGESTFMVEMNETANILNNATQRSLVILDEVGRGTSTYDGVAIAWALVEFIIEKIQAKTLFATHYHELVDLAQKYSNLKNYTVMVKETDGEILFQHKISEGSANRSYGIHVAQMAGVPEEVISRAKQILEGFENKDKSRSRDQKSSPTRPKNLSPEQLGLI